MSLIITISHFRYVLRMLRTNIRKKMFFSTDLIFLHIFLLIGHTAVGMARAICRMCPCFVRELAAAENELPELV